MAKDHLAKYEPYRSIMRAQEYEMSHVAGIAVFEVFPEIQRLEKTTIQRLCDEWRATPVAKEFAITKLSVDDRLLLKFECQFTHELQSGEAYYFPIDRLLLYIADYGLSDPGERETAKQRILTAREHGGPDVFRQFKIQLGPKLPLFITCTKCGNIMQTQWYTFRCETVEIEGGEVECTNCRHVFPIDGSELHLEPGT